MSICYLVIVGNKARVHSSYESALKDKDYSEFLLSFSNSNLPVRIETFSDREEVDIYFRMRSLTIR